MGRERGHAGLKESIYIEREKEGLKRTDAVASNK